mmetsp:Transcript_5979/g.16740  ORF Transcript_5979/g.16740 Transcript_5979/m.16740 type:complete len:258 (-) Transcript_5979:88-861(-)
MVASLVVRGHAALRLQPERAHGAALLCGLPAAQVHGGHPGEQAPELSPLREPAEGRVQAGGLGQGHPASARAEHEPDASRGRHHRQRARQDLAAHAARRRGHAQALQDALQRRHLALPAHPPAEEVRAAAPRHRLPSGALLRLQGRDAPTSCALASGAPHLGAALQGEHHARAEARAQAPHARPAPPPHHHGGAPGAVHEQEPGRRPERPRAVRQDGHDVKRACRWRQMARCKRVCLRQRVGRSGKECASEHMLERS